MKVKINNKPHKIKPSEDLTVSEYVKIFDGLKDNVSNLEMLIRHVSVTTGNTYKDIADINMNENSIRRLFAYIGAVQQVNEISESKEFYYRKSGKTLYQKKINWRTIGVRKLLEDRKADSQVEQAVYLLAVYISADYDNEKIEEIYQELQDYNAIEVLSFIIFFFRKLYLGKSLGSNFLQKLRRKVSINIPKQSSQ